MTPAGTFGGYTAEERTILHCDMNNFFASIECLHQPELAVKPVAVCGAAEMRQGIVLAKNGMAKELLFVGKSIQHQLFLRRILSIGDIAAADPLIREEVRAMSNEVVRSMSDKVAVSVKVEFDLFGQLTPLSFLWENGVQYEVSRVVDRRRAVSLKAGGGGMRYTCKVNGRLVYLFYDDTVWYLEKKQ